MTPWRGCVQGTKSREEGGLLRKMRNQCSLAGPDFQPWTRGDRNVFCVEGRDTMPIALRLLGFIFQKTM